MFLLDDSYVLLLAPTNEQCLPRGLSYIVGQRASMYEAYNTAMVRNEVYHQLNNDTIAAHDGTCSYVQKFLAAKFLCRSSKEHLHVHANCRIFTPILLRNVVTSWLSCNLDDDVSSSRWQDNRKERSFLQSCLVETPTLDVQVRAHQTTESGREDSSCVCV